MSLLAVESEPLSSDLKRSKRATTTQKAEMLIRSVQCRWGIRPWTEVIILGHWAGFMFLGLRKFGVGNCILQIRLGENYRTPVLLWIVIEFYPFNFKKLKLKF